MFIIFISNFTLNRLNKIANVIKKICGESKIELAKCLPKGGCTKISVRGRGVSSKTPGKILFYFPSLVIFLKTGDISEGGGRSDLIEKI